MASKKRAQKKQDFMEYLDNSTLVHNYFLTKNENLFFHWANWNETCEYQKKYLTQDSSHKAKLKELDEQLLELKKVDVWVKNKMGSTKMSLYDIYEGYLDNRMRMTWFDRTDILLAFEGEAGPYISLANMRWFNRETYSAFMFRKLLTTPIPSRGFRIGLKAPVACRFDGSPLNTADFTLHQASEFGIILNVGERNNLSKIINSKKIEIELDVTPFLNVSGAKYKDVVKVFEAYDFNNIDTCEKKVISLNSDIINKFNNHRNALSAGEEDFYFFIPYKELFKEEEDKPVKEAFKSFVESIKDGLNSQIKKAS